MLSKLYLSGIEILGGEVEVVQHIVSKLYLSGIEIREDADELAPSDLQIVP